MIPVEIAVTAVSPIIFSGGDSLPTDIVDVDDTDDADGDVWGWPLWPLSTIVAALDSTSRGDSVDGQD